VPFTLFGTSYICGCLVNHFRDCIKLTQVDNRPFFKGFVVVSFIRVLISMGICVIYPVVESTGALRDISKGLWNDVMAVVGRSKPKRDVPSVAAYLSYGQAELSTPTLIEHWDTSPDDL
jgi:hypothetical protein